MREPIRAGDMVWLPNRMRANPPAEPTPLDLQALAYWDRIAAEPRRVIWAESVWAMVDCGSWGEHGLPSADLRKVNDEPTTMRFFGNPPAWDAPVTEGRYFGPPPAGDECAGGCGAPIGAYDTGVQMPLLDEPPRLVAWHVDCFLRNVLGPDISELTDV